MGFLGWSALLSDLIYIKVLTFEETTNSNSQGIVPLSEDYDGMLRRILLESKRSPYRDTSCIQTARSNLSYLITFLLTIDLLNMPLSDSPW